MVRQKKIKEESLRQELLDDPELNSPQVGTWAGAVADAGERGVRVDTLTVLVPTQAR